MTKDEFSNDYIGAFNRGDLATCARFYDENVILHLGSRVLNGRQAIIDFYTEVFERIRETLTIKSVILDESGLAAEIATEFYCLKDWPEFIAGPIRAGETIRIESFIHYHIGPNGKFTEIWSARAKG